jgi:hypothetical protein
MRGFLDWSYSVVMGTWFAVLLLTGVLIAAPAAAQTGPICCSEDQVHCPSTAPCIDGNRQPCPVCTLCCVVG